MRTTTFILALMAMFTLSAAEVNLFKNGDFAEGGKHWMLLKGAKVSTDVKADGKNSVAITKGQQVIQNVTVDPQADYLLTFKMKGENIAKGKHGQGARIIIRGGKRYGRGTADPKGNSMTGTFDWKEGKALLKGSYFQSNKLVFTMHLDTEGTCYFADFKLVKVAAEAKAK